MQLVLKAAYKSTTHCIVSILLNEMASLVFHNGFAACCTVRIPEAGPLKVNLRYLLNGKSRTEVRDMVNCSHFSTILRWEPVVNFPPVSEAKNSVVQS